MAEDIHPNYAILTEFAELRETHKDTPNHKTVGSKVAVLAKENGRYVILYGRITALGDEYTVMLPSGREIGYISYHHMISV